MNRSLLLDSGLLLLRGLLLAQRVLALQLRLLRPSLLVNLPLRLHLLLALDSLLLHLLVAPPAFRLLKLQLLRRLAALLVACPLPVLLNLRRLPGLPRAGTATIGWPASFDTGSGRLRLRPANHGRCRVLGRRPRLPHDDSRNLRRWLRLRARA